MRSGLITDALLVGLPMCTLAALMPPAFHLSELDGRTGFVASGIDARDRTGISVSTAGEVNGNGVDDLIIGAPNADSNSNSLAGESYVVFGGSGVGSTGSLELDSLDGSNGLVLYGFGEADFSRGSVNTAGDVNGDGVSDVIIGAPRADVETGESYVLFMPLADTAEPNIELGDATPISLGQTLSSSIAPVGDQCAGRW